MRLMFCIPKITRGRVFESDQKTKASRYTNIIRTILMSFISFLNCLILKGGSLKGFVPSHNCSN